MSTEYSGKYCRYCRRYRSIRRPQLGGCSIVLGTILSLGILLPLIVLYQMGFSGWRCCTCGRSV